MKDNDSEINATIDNMRQEFIDLVNSGEIPSSGQLADRYVELGEDLVDTVLDGFERLKNATSPEERAAILMELEALTAGVAGEGLISGLDSYDDFVRQAGLEDLVLQIPSGSVAFGNAFDELDVNGDEDWDIDTITDFDIGSHELTMSGDISQPKQQDEPQLQSVPVDFKLG